MTWLKTIGLSLGTAVIVLLNPAYVLAEGSNYQEDMTPGLQIRASSKKGSVLSEAARYGGSVVISGSEEETDDNTPIYETRTQSYTVQEGDTLWDICSRHFGDAYVWPLIWSYNPKITNPNWIYPGDVVWLSAAPADGMLAAQPLQTGESEVGGQGPSISRIPNVTFLRNRGFVDKEALKRAGEIVGSHKTVRYVAQYDEAYVEFGEDVPVNTGDEFAVFKVIRPIKGIEDRGTEIGKLVEIYGQVRVTHFDKDKRIARVVIDESLKEMERGQRVGAVHRRFEMIPPVINDRNLEGHLLAILDPVILTATHQIVFIDRGTSHGVRDGNRFFATEIRDNWRASRGEKDDREGYPKEVLAEIRVIEARPETSTCLITSTIRELEVGQKVELRKGY